MQKKERAAPLAGNAAQKNEPDAQTVAQNPAKRNGPRVNLVHMPGYCAVCPHFQPGKTGTAGHCAQTGRRVDALNSCHIQKKRGGRA